MITTVLLVGLIVTQIVALLAQHSAHSDTAESLAGIEQELSELTAAQVANAANVRSALERLPKSRARRNVMLGGATVVDDEEPIQ